MDHSPAWGNYEKALYHTFRPGLVVEDEAEYDAMASRMNEAATLDRRVTRVFTRDNIMAHQRFISESTNFGANPGLLNPLGPEEFPLEATWLDAPTPEKPFYYDEKMLLREFCVESTPGYCNDSQASADIVKKIHAVAEERGWHIRTFNQEVVTAYRYRLQQAKDRSRTSSRPHRVWDEGDSTLYTACSLWNASRGIWDLLILMNRAILNNGWNTPLVSLLDAQDHQRAKHYTISGEAISKLTGVPLNCEFNTYEVQLYDEAMVLKQKNPRLLTVDCANWMTTIADQRGWITRTFTYTDLEFHHNRQAALARAAAATPPPATLPSPASESVSATASGSVSSSDE